MGTNSHILVTCATKLGLRLKWKEVKISKQNGFRGDKLCPQGDCYYLVFASHHSLLRLLCVATEHGRRGLWGCQVRLWMHYGFSFALRLASLAKLCVWMIFSHPWGKAF